MDTLISETDVVASNTMLRPEAQKATMQVMPELDDEAEAPQAAGGVSEAWSTLNPDSRKDVVAPPPYPYGDVVPPSCAAEDIASPSGLAMFSISTSAFAGGGQRITSPWPPRVQVRCVTNYALKGGSVRLAPESAPTCSSELRFQTTLRGMQHIYCITG